MKEGRTVTRYILLLVIICILAGIAAAETTFYSGCSISTSTSATVQGTINESVSLKKSTVGGDMDKTEFSNSYTTVNPLGLSWRSYLSVNSDEESARVAYSRSGGLPRLTWNLYFKK